MRRSVRSNAGKGVEELSSMESYGIVWSEEQTHMRHSTRSNAGKGVPKLKVSFGGKKYSTVTQAIYDESKELYRRTNCYHETCS